MDIVGDKSAHSKPLWGERELGSHPDASFPEGCP